MVNVFIIHPEGRKGPSPLLPLLLAAAILFSGSLPACAETDSAVPRPALLGLARQFVDKMQAGFERADEALISPEEKRNQRYKVDIPDGEMLLLRVGLSKASDRGNRYKLLFDEPVIAIKQGDDVMVSLSDFFNVAQFAIEVKPAAGAAEGWFIRKGQMFRLDANAMTATVQGREFTLSEGDIAVEETDILVKSKILEKWFDFDSEVILATQLMGVKTEQKWPSLEKLERLRRKGRHYLPPPELPRQEEPYEWVSVPNTYVTTSRTFSRSGSGAIGRSSDYKLDATGDMLKHTSRIVASGSLDPGEKKIDSLRATFKRESDRPDLLGWMGAHKYEFGDIGGVGITATNRDPYITSNPVTVIEGDMTPGWDAELYRGAEYVGSDSDQDGIYRFEDIPLVPGVNGFKIVKYGPLGEIEEEELTVLSTFREKGLEGGLYNVSLSAAATSLWTQQPQESQDKYTPVFNGNYQWQVSDLTSMKVGLQTSQKQGEQKTFPSVGVVSYVDNTFLNADLSVDVDGAATASAAARRAVLGQNVMLGASYTTDDYGAVSGAQIPGQYSLNAAVRGRTPYVPATYALGTFYSEDDLGNVRTRDNLSLSGRVLDMGASTSLERTTLQSSRRENESLSGSSALSGRLGRTNWRASADYSIVPDGWSMNSYNLNLSRGLAKNVGGSLALQNDPGADSTKGTASVIWTGKYAKVAPSISYDSANNFSFLLTTSSGFAYDSYGSDALNAIVMRSKDTTKFGGVSAFVYLDRDGDLAFSEGDEPIQDAIVEAVHSRASATTDAKGEAFIYDLPANIVTDVRLNEYSFFDPYFVPGFKGISILPRAGHEARIEFPVHNGGEMDGTVYVQPAQGKPRSIRNVHLMLYDMDGRLAHSAVTSFDGFFLFQKIHPGSYYLVIDEKDAKNFGFTRPSPEIISFGYEGTIIYGHNITLPKTEPDGPGDVPLNMGADYTDYVSINPAFDQSSLDGKAIVLNLGSYHSNLLTTLMWYKIVSRYGAIVGGGTLLVDPPDSYASAETGLHTLRVRIPGFDMEDARHRCRALIARGLYCGVEVMPQLERKEADAGGNNG